MASTPRSRIERALAPYLPWQSARLRSIELARILKDTTDPNEARGLVEQKLGQLDIHHAIPAEILPAVVDLVISAWQVIPLDPGMKKERG